MPLASRLCHLTCDRDKESGTFLTVLRTCVCLYTSLHADWVWQTPPTVCVCERARRRKTLGVGHWKRQTFCVFLTNLIRMPISDLEADWVIVRYVMYLLCRTCKNLRVTFVSVRCTDHNRLCHWSGLDLFYCKRPVVVYKDWSVKVAELCFWWLSLLLVTRSEPKNVLLPLKTGKNLLNH